MWYMLDAITAITKWAIIACYAMTDTYPCQKTGRGYAYCGLAGQPLATPRQKKKKKKKKKMAMPMQ